jgi:exopolysaccharide production protein ExoZ
MRLTNLQYLRALAAGLVALLHAAIEAGLSFSIGEMGVDIFFVLSGFLMWTITANETRPLAFLRDRVRRIMPSYWLVTIAVSIAIASGLYRTTTISFDQAVMSLLFIPHFSTDGLLYPVLKQGWTLNYEMFFYALFAATLLLPRRYRAWALIAMLGALVALGLLFSPTDAMGIFYTDPIMLEFTLGIGLGILWERGYSRAGFGVVAAISTIGLLLSMIVEERLFFFGMPALLIVALALAFEKVGKVPHLPLVKLLGDASYSIYLWHTIAISACVRIVSHFGLDPLFVMVAGPPAGIALGMLVYWAVEEPLLKLMRKSPDRAIPSATGISAS